MRVGLQIAAAVLGCSTVGVIIVLCFFTDYSK